MSLKKLRVKSCRLPISNVNGFCFNRNPKVDKIGRGLRSTTAFPDGGSPKRKNNFFGFFVN